MTNKTDPKATATPDGSAAPGDRYRILLGSNPADVGVVVTATEAELVARGATAWEYYGTRPRR